MLVLVGCGCELLLYSCVVFDFYGKLLLDSDVVLELDAELLLNSLVVLDLYRELLVICTGLLQESCYPFILLGHSSELFFIFTELSSERADLLVPLVAFPAEGLKFYSQFVPVML